MHTHIQKTIKSNWFNSLNTKSWVLNGDDSKSTKELAMRVTLWAISSHCSRRNRSPCGLC